LAASAGGWALRAIAGGRECGQGQSTLRGAGVKEIPRRRPVTRLRPEVAPAAAVESPWPGPCRQERARAAWRLAPRPSPGATRRPQPGAGGQPGDLGGGSSGFSHSGASGLTFHQPSACATTVIMQMAGVRARRGCRSWPNGSEGFQQALLRRHGQPVRPPQRPHWRPGAESLGWHRQEVFKAEARHRG
jgi:hypothetical protein